MQVRIPEQCLLDLGAIERAMIERAIIKAERHPELAARIEAKTEHLAILELNILESGARDLCKAEIAAVEFAFDELYS